MIRRYEKVRGQMQQHGLGRYVEYDDHQAALLEAREERDRLREALRKLREPLALGPLEMAAKYGPDVDPEGMLDDACREADELLFPQEPQEGSQ